MTQKIGIVLVGLNGAGKSTVAKYAATELGLDALEVEDYWLKNKHDYQNPRDANEVSKLLIADIKGFIISGNLSSLSKELLNVLSLIIHVEVEKELRVARIIQRNLDIYGERQSTAPLYHERQSFLSFVKARTATSLLEWIAETQIPSMMIDGNLSLEKNLRIVRSEINSQVQKAQSFFFINSLCE